jgi:hypothetical protein
MMNPQYVPHSQGNEAVVVVRSTILIGFGRLSTNGVIFDFAPPNTPTARITQAAGAIGIVANQ